MKTLRESLIDTLWFIQRLSNQTGDEWTNRKARELSCDLEELKQEEDDFKKRISEIEEHFKKQDCKKA